MKILSLSDEDLDQLYTTQAKERFAEVDLIIGCGDLSYCYLEFLVSLLDKPTFFVRGNHDKVMEYKDAGPRSEPHGAIDLHRRVFHHKGVILAGVEGSLRYKPGPFMYTQGEMLLNVLRLAPRLLWNRVRYGRFLDIFVTHAPPLGIHDDYSDLPHRGIRAFLWFDRVFQPALHLHGHIHVYRWSATTETCLGKTRVINTYGYRLTEFTPPSS